MKRLVYVIGMVVLPVVANAECYGIDNSSLTVLQSLKNKVGAPCIWGLVTNQTGLNQSGERTVKVLTDYGVSVRAIFAPEHGYYGTVLAGVAVAEQIDPQTRIPILSFYKKNVAQTLTAATQKLVDPQVLQDIDGFIVDIQDAGMRHYTYCSALYQVMELARAAHKKVVVLDRPNPLGRRVDGPLVEPGLISYISITPVPVRHGLTFAEFARYCNRYCFNNEVELYIVPLAHYSTTAGLSRLPAPLSPNIASLDACKGYSFLGLLGEVEPFDVGVKTPHAFSCLALPVSVVCAPGTWKECQRLLKEYHVESEPFEYMSGTKNQRCKGVRIMIPHIHNVRSFALFIALLELFKKAGVVLKCSVSFDKAVGTTMVREWLIGKKDKGELYRSIDREIALYIQRAQAILLYDTALSYQPLSLSTYVQKSV